MNGQQAVTAVAKMIAEAGMGVSVFKYEKPPKFKGEYIVVNQLTFGRSAFQQSYVNVNIHVPDTASKEPNTRRIGALTEMVEPLFRNTLYDGAYYNIDSDSFFPDNDGTHYQNLRIQVTYLNLNQNE